MANHGPSYGLSRELELKNKARFNLREAKECLDWIQQVTASPFPTAPRDMRSESEVVDALKDGVQLCRLYEAIVGRGALEYRPTARLPFYQMENIEKFLSAIKSYGVPEHSLFQTVDLYEGKQTYKVLECLRALAGVAKKNGAGIVLPGWVVKQDDRHIRHFDAATLALGKMTIGLQYGVGFTPNIAGSRHFNRNTQLQKSWELKKCSKFKL